MAATLQAYAVDVLAKVADCVLTVLEFRLVTCAAADLLVLKTTIDSCCYYYCEEVVLIDLGVVSYTLYSFGCLADAGICWGGCWWIGLRLADLYLILYIGISYIVIWRLRTAWAAFVLRTCPVRGLGVTRITPVSMSYAVEFGLDFSVGRESYESTTAAFPLFMQFLSAWASLSIGVFAVGSSVQ